jgi:hypothetical protein
MYSSVISGTPNLRGVVSPETMARTGGRGAVHPPTNRLGAVGRRMVRDLGVARAPGRTLRYNEGMTDLPCSFCGQSQGARRCVISGSGGVAICNQCVAVCADVFERTGVPLPPTVTLDQRDVGGDWRARVTAAQPERPSP